MPLSNQKTSLQKNKEKLSKELDLISLAESLLKESPVHMVHDNTLYGKLFHASYREEDISVPDLLAMFPPCETVTFNNKFFYTIPTPLLESCGKYSGQALIRKFNVCLKVFNHKPEVEWHHILECGGGVIKISIELLTIAKNVPVKTRKSEYEWNTINGPSYADMLPISISKLKPSSASDITEKTYYYSDGSLLLKEENLLTR